MTTLPIPFIPNLDDVNAILEDAVALGASDIVLKALSKPVMKLHGHWHRIDDLPPLTINDVQEVLKLIIGDDRYATFQGTKEADFQLGTPTCRFRVNAALQRGGPFLTFRPIPASPPKLDDLQLLEEDRILNVLKNLITLPRGLILVTGPTGSGKSTTLAAMINHLNHTQKRHVITIEDPIEFMHPDVQCVIEQREVGQDTHGFSQALRGVLRQTPDVILVGEMRDPETIEAAITAAETGHLVISTVHTNSAPESISRILDVMPGDRQNQIKTQLAATLKAVITQQLVPRASGEGRQIVLEIMIVDKVLGAIITSDSKNTLASYYDHMHSHAEDGNTMMDRHLAIAVKMGRVTAASAEARVVERKRYDSYMSTLNVRETPTARANPFTRR